MKIHKEVIVYYLHYHKKINNKQDQLLIFKILIIKIISIIN